MSDTITAQEIKEIRGKYGLTQKSFALLLGIGPASMVRYEQGSQPSKANANLIRAARHPEFMRECLERDGDLIPKRQSEQASRVVYAIVSLDPTEGEGVMEATTTRGSAFSEVAEPAPAPRTMDEVYHYTIQQEVLNEQAANLMGEMISMKVATGFTGSAADVLDKLLDQVAEIKPTIVSSSMMDDLKLSSVRGYLNCANDLVTRYRMGVA